jgi:hypothetical protein
MATAKIGSRSNRWHWIFMKAAVRQTDMLVLDAQCGRVRVVLTGGVLVGHQASICRSMEETAPTNGGGNAGT